MSTYAIAIADNKEVSVEFAHAGSLRNAIRQHSRVREDFLRDAERMTRWFNTMPDDLEGIKEHFAATDQRIDVKIVPDEMLDFTGVDGIRYGYPIDSIVMQHDPRINTYYISDIEVSHYMWKLIDTQLQGSTQC